MTNDEVAELFVQSGALLRGHFVLTSGRHSDQYFEKFDVLRWPEHVATLCAELAVRVRAAGIEATVVLGPTTLGIVLAYELGRQLGLPAAYGEKNAEGQQRHNKLQVDSIWRFINPKYKIYSIYKLCYGISH